MISRILSFSYLRPFIFDAKIIIFFSSRRRHTRYWRDWSSDVCSSDLETVKASVLWLFLFGTLLTISEICFSPLGNSFISKHAPKKYLSLLLGVWLFASFAAAKLNGYIQIFVEKLGIMAIFNTFAIVSFVTAIILFLLTKPLTRLMKDDEE